MKKIGQAPNVAIAQLWADMLTEQGVQVSVERFYLSGAAGELPPDQCLPQLWVHDDDQLDEAQRILAEIARIPQRHWICASCAEHIEGGFEQCWSCGAGMP